MAVDRRCIIPIQVAQDSATLLKQMLDPRKVLDTGCRVIKHPHCCAICAANNDCKKIPMHVMCVIGSTRVSAPVVPADVAHRLTLDSVASGVGDGRDGGLAAATAVTKAEGDFGRGSIRKVAVRDYVGDVVVIRTASGKELTGTPNHPVATRSGWVALAELQVGDHVLRSTRAEWELGPVDPDEDDVPPTIEQVAQTFPVTSGPMPTSSEDFHGDGVGSEVHVVLTDGLLVSDDVALCSEHLRELQLRWGDASVDPVFAGAGTSFQLSQGMFSSASCVVGGGGESGALSGGRAGHAGVHGLASTADRDSSLGEPLSDQVPADAEGFCEGLLAFSVDVAEDEILEVNRSAFAGHVYNLETVEGWYVADSIITHNCRCRPEPYLINAE